MSEIRNLHGLVLAGGRSVRMGEDKSMIRWHDKEQCYHMADLLKNFCDAVYISCRRGQQLNYHEDYGVIEDQDEDAGPLGAILTAFHLKTTAWLVVACDLPLLDHSTLKFLVDNREQSEDATSFKSPYDELPEPLIAIWEPGMLPKLEMGLIDGKKCPRKILMNTSVMLLNAPDDNALFNANTPEDRQNVVDVLSSRPLKGESS